MLTQPATNLPADPQASVRVSVPRKLQPLLQPARYKACFGGRGGGKSHFFAELLVARCFAGPVRAVCIREVQASIRESVRQLLVDKISKFGLEWFFHITEREIRGRNGSLIIFKGMQHYNAENIKSLEGFDIAWVEEAQVFSERSLRMLRPTIIRKEGSEQWYSWNPRSDQDAVDKFFRGGGRDFSSAILVETNWRDNPFLTADTIQEKDEDYAADPDVAENVWGGAYESVTEGAYYAKLILAAERQGRIGDFPYDPEWPLFTAWDIGVDDYTAIWFLQVIGGTRVVAVDYFETQNEGAEQIRDLALPELNPKIDQAAAQLIELGRLVPYRYKKHFLPHDVKVREWGAGAKSRVLTLMGLGVKPINAGVAADPSDRINAGRALLPMCYFNDSPTVQVGIRRLRRYSRKFNKALGVWGSPEHDENCHGADAFGEFALNCGIKPPKTEKPEEPKWPYKGEGVASPRTSAALPSAEDILKGRLRRNEDD